MIANFVSWVRRFTLLGLTKNWTMSMLLELNLFICTSEVHMKTYFKIIVSASWCWCERKVRKYAYMLSAQRQTFNKCVSSYHCPLSPTDPQKEWVWVWDPETYKFSQLCRQPWGSESILNNYFLLLFCENLNKWCGFFVFFFLLKKNQ